jgi:iron complex outermembrane receptor protein
MKKFVRITATAVFVCHGLLAAARAQSAAPSPTDTKEPIFVLEKFVTENKGEDPNAIMPTQPVDILGLDKKIVETPRSISLVSGEMIDKFNMNELADLSRFAPSTYTAFSFGVQGGLSIRGDSSDTYYGDMKKLNNGSNLKMIVGASDGVTIVRGPPSAVLGAGQVGGFMNYLPKSARAATGKYLESPTGKFSYTRDQWGKNVGTAEVGGPVKFGKRRAGYYVYAQVERSDTYYVGQRIEDELIQATFTADLTDWLRLEVNLNYQNHLGTGIAGWNRVTQDLVDNRTYMTGSPNFSLIDTNNDGWGSLSELWNAGLINDYRFNAPGVRGSNTVKAGTTAYTALNGPLAFVTNVGFTKLSPRNVLLERINSGDEHIGIIKLVADANPNLIFKNYLFYNYQDYYKLSDIAYMRSGNTYLFEEKFSTEWRVQGLPDWLAITNITALNYRYLDAYNNTTNYHQIFNYWDLTVYTDGHYKFYNGWENPVEAGIGSATTSRHSQGGIGNILDITAFNKLNLSVGYRHDWVDGNVISHPAIRNNGTAIPVTSGAGSGNKGSLTSASLSYKVLPNLIPYVTYAEPQTVLPGSTGGLSIAQVTDVNGPFNGAKLKEVGIKGEFFKGKLFASYAYYDQLRTAWDQTLNEGDGGFRQTKAVGHEVEARYVPNRNFNIALAMDWMRRDNSPLAPGFIAAPVQTVGLDPVQFGAGRYQIAYNPAITRQMRPARVFSLFGNYIFGKTGWDISAGSNYVSGYTFTTVGDIRMGDKITYSMDVGYQLDKHWSFRLSGKNLSNELYFTSTSGSAGLIPQPGRTITGKISYRF